MSERKINLDDYVDELPLGVASYRNKIKIVLKDFAKQLLELAAENAKTTEISIENWEEIDYESDFNYIPLMNEWEEIEGLNKIIINKQSILDIIKQVE